MLRCAILILSAHLLALPAAVGASADTLDFVRERLGVWQERLNLSDWNISVVMSDRARLKQGTVGGIRWDKGRKSAVITLLASHPREELEMTVVHELVHLRLASLPRSEASRGSEEKAVDSIAAALLTLERRK